MGANTIPQKSIKQQEKGWGITYIDLSLFSIKLVPWNQPHLIEIPDGQNRDIGVITTKYKRDILELTVENIVF